jgi:hypothetical protein
VIAHLVMHDRVGRHSTLMGGVGKWARRDPDGASESRVLVDRTDHLAALWFAVVTVVAVAWLIAIEPITCAVVGAPARYPCPTGVDRRHAGAALVTLGALICGLAGTFRATTRA